MFGGRATNYGKFAEIINIRLKKNGKVLQFSGQQRIQSVLGIVCVGVGLETCEVLVSLLVNKVIKIFQFLKNGAI